MAKSREPLMDEKAANEGDKLKHSLLLEVLDRCAGWGSITYAETHAGAGKYLVTAQQPDAQYITELFRFFSNVAAEPSVMDAGGRYYHLLKAWFSDSTLIR